VINLPTVSSVYSEL